MFTYLMVNAGTILFPFLFSFNKRKPFYKLWKYFFPANIITAIAYLIWDVYFTKLGVWGFNPKYLIGVDIVNLPLEEYLFFFTIPYACLFTYEAMKYFFKTEISQKSVSFINISLITLCLVISISNYGKYYTFYSFLLCAIVLILHQFWIRKKYLVDFYLSFLVLLLPFLIVNGILTGSGLEEQVVWYNNDHNLGIRIFTIPVDDISYSFSLLLIQTTIFEKLKNYY